MKNKITLIVVLIMLIASVSGTVEILNISRQSVFAKLSRGNVIFPHERHYGWGIDCLRCHHRYEKGENVLAVEELIPGSAAVSCSSCHSSSRDLERAYHRMCITCHRDMNKNNIRSGPVMCGQCHAKKEK